MKLKTSTQPTATLIKRTHPTLDFSAIPEDLQYHHIARYCDYSTLAAFARTHKDALRQLLPEFERRLPALRVNIGTGSSHVFVFSHASLYACGDNSDGQLGLGDNEQKQDFTLVTALPKAIKQQGQHYQHCQRLIALQRHGMFTPAPAHASTRQEAPESQASHHTQTLELNTIPTL